VSIPNVTWARKSFVADVGEDGLRDNRRPVPLARSMAGCARERENHISLCAIRGRSLQLETTIGRSGVTARLSLVSVTRTLKVCGPFLYFVVSSE